MGPAVALSDPASSPAAVTGPTVDDDLDDAQVPDGVLPGDSFEVDATEIAERDDVADVCWKFDENDTCHDARTTHAFEEVGPHTATLIAVDESGERSSKTFLVVATTPPTAALSAPESAEAGTEVQLDAGDSSDDYEIESYEWDLNGDGTVDETTTSPELSHTFEESGSHEVTVTAVDAVGQSDTASATVAVTEVEQSQASIVGGLLNSAAVVGVVIAIGVVTIGTLLFARAEG